MQEKIIIPNKIINGQSDYRLHFPSWTIDELNIIAKDPVHGIFLLHPRPWSLGAGEENKIAILDSQNKEIMIVELFNQKYKLYDLASKIIYGYNNIKTYREKYIKKPDGSFALTPFADLDRTPPPEMRGVIEAIAKRKKEMQDEIIERFKQLETNHKLKKEMIIKQKEASIENKRKEKEERIKKNDTK